MTVFQGKKIAGLRAAKGLTQQELADAAQVSRETVIRAEKMHNVPGGEAIARLAKVLDITIDDLFEEPAGTTNGSER